MNLTLYSNSNLEKYLNRSLDFLIELPSLWASIGYKEKQELHRTIFPDGIFYSKKKGETRTTKINGVFSLIARQKGVSEEKENRNSEIIFKSSGLGSPSDSLSHQIIALLKKLYLIFNEK